MKSLPLLQFESLTAITAEIASIQVDSFLSPEKPILQLPYQHSSSKKPITLSLVFDRMQNHRLPSYSAHKLEAHGIEACCFSISRFPTCGSM